MKKRLVALVLVLVVAFALVACGKVKPSDTTPTPEPTKPQEATTAPEPTKDAQDTPAPTAEPSKIPATTEIAELKFTKGTELRMACGYNNADTGLFYSEKIAGSGITLADGNTYFAGDLKPTWVRVEEVLGMKFTDKYQGKSATDEFKYWADQLDQVDMVSGSASLLTEYGVKGSLVNIAEFLDYMPNFKAYLEANPIVRLSIVGETTTGAIYFSPYFDGVDDIERMTLMRTDWVEKLLNGSAAFTAEKCGELAAPVYTPYMPTSGKIEVEVVNKADISKVDKITKDYDAAGNIVKTMNDKLAAGKVNGVEAVAMLREYIDKAYNGYYGENRADLFVGQNAAWDVDELVALLRCVVANANTLNGTDKVSGIFTRENSNNQRLVDMYRLAGTLFGVRGLESRLDYLYFEKDGKLHDARQEAATYEAIEKMQDMAKEGLIAEEFLNGQDVKTAAILKNDMGFMHYDYNQTQTLYNESGELDKAAGEKYMAVMVPVARWYDGTDANGVYMRFTESWRSVKTDGWGISVAGVDYKGDGVMTDKLKAALSIVDYAYSPEGMILMSYGPDAFISKNADGSYETFNFNGKEMPVVSTGSWESLWSLAGGNYTNYARQYLGSTLSFAKSQAFEYQCTTAAGKEGAGYISTAIGAGIIKHPMLEVCDNMWYTSVPTVISNTASEQDTLNELTALSSNYNSSKGKYNILVELIQKKGYEGNQLDLTSRDALINAAVDTWGGQIYLHYKQLAWERVLAYFNTLAK